MFKYLKEVMRMVIQQMKFKKQQQMILQLIFLLDGNLGKMEFDLETHGLTKIK